MVPLPSFKPPRQTADALRFMFALCVGPSVNSLRLVQGYRRFLPTSSETMAPQNRGRLWDRSSSAPSLLPVELELVRLDFKSPEVKLHGVGLNLQPASGIFQQVRFVGASNPGSQFDLYSRGRLAGGFIDSKHGRIAGTRLESRQHDIGVRDFKQSP